MMENSNKTFMRSKNIEKQSLFSERKLVKTYHTKKDKYRTNTVNTKVVIKLLPINKNNQLNCRF